MKPEKPFLFIGSSQECREAGIVDEFIQALSDHAHSIPWYADPQFKEKGSATTFGALCEAAKEYDFALFLLTPDDQINSRGETRRTPRDNVLFELGLFISAIGAERVMAFVQESSEPVKVPSDLSGVTMPRFYYEQCDTKKSRASVLAATRGFASNIEKSRFRKIDLHVVDTWGFNSASGEFEVELSASRITRARSTIGKWRLAIAARIRDLSQNMEDDERVVYTAVRSLPPSVDHNIPFRIREHDFQQPITPGDVIEARVLLVPESLHFEAPRTLREALNARCREVETMSYQTATASTEGKQD